MDSYHLFYNRLITDEHGRALKAMAIVPNRTVVTVQDLRDERARINRDAPRLVRRSINRILARVPDGTQGAEQPGFVLVVGGGGVLALAGALLRRSMLPSKP